MKLKYINILILLAVLMACEAAEELFKERKAPEIISVESNKGWTVNPGDTVSITVNASNPEEGALTYKWTVSSGTIIDGNFEPILIWKAPVIGDSYSIEIEVSNEHKSKTETVTIEVASTLKPYVNIISPQAGSFVVKHTTKKVEFEASHGNGIAQFYVYINDQLLDSLNGNAEEYNWNVMHDAGTTEIKIEAISRLTTKSGFDSVNVTIAGIIPGKRND